MTKRLLVIAGPSAVGKSTLMDRLFSGQEPEVAACLRFDPSEKWNRLRSRTLPEADRLLGDRVLLHYDLHRPDAQGFSEGYPGDPIWGRFRDGWSITFLTLWVPTNVLQERIRLRRAPLKVEFFKVWKIRTVLHRWSRCRKLEQWCQEPGRLCKTYKRWFEFTSTFPQSERFVLDMQNDSAACVSQIEWKGMREAACV